MTLSIGEVAARTGLRPSALRYYEELGLIQSAARRSGRRHFNQSVLSRLGFISLAQSLGFTLDEVATLLDGRPQVKERWKRLAEQKLGDLGRQMDELRRMMHLLSAALACGCESVEGCQLVEDAAAERRAHGRKTVRPRRPDARIGSRRGSAPPGA